jgi:hypothetical protein
VKQISHFLLFFLVSCQAVENIKQRTLEMVGQAPAPITVDDTFTPEPPPSMEKDVIVKLTPKEKILTLFEQFNRGPDDYLLGLIISELTQNKALFTTARDSSLENVLNRLVPWVQQGQVHTLSLLVQMLPVMVGENKDLVKIILSRAFDSAPILLIDMLLKRSEDKLCYMASMTPTEVSVDNKRNYLESRRDQLAALKDAPGLTAAHLNYLELCLRTLELTLAPKDAPPPVEAPAITIEPTTTTTPVEPPTSATP